MEKKCGYCGKLLIMPLWRIRTCKFCNRDCYVEGMKGKTNNGSFKKGLIPWNTGKKVQYTKEHIEAIKRGALKRRGENAKNWKGGQRIYQGYRWVLVNGIHVFEHRHLVEKYLKRKLKRSEIIHHLNGNRLDNRLFNLYIFASHSEHSKYEGRKRNGYIVSTLKSNLKDFKQK